MAYGLSTASVYTDFQGFDALRKDAREQSPEVLRKVAQQFEALFVQMMLKNMREASFGDELFGSDESKFYQGMFDQQIALHLSSKGSLGLADLLVRQLGDRAAPQPPAPEPDAGNDAIAIKPVPVPIGSDPIDLDPIPMGSDPIGRDRDQWGLTPLVAAAPTGGSADDVVETDVIADPVREVVGSAPIESPRDFVRVLEPHAVAAARRLGVKSEVLLAQAALETGWGKRIMAHPDGRSSHNLFGIKADRRWTGDQVVTVTVEYENGLAVKRREAFRAYDSYAASFSDYVDFLQSSPRYDQALVNAGDGRRFVQELQGAGYATDPDYSKKIHDILNGMAFAEPG